MFDHLEEELEARKHSPGLRMADLLSLPEALSHLLRWMIRQKRANLAEIIKFLGKDESAAKDLLADAQSMGFVRKSEIHGTTLYYVRMAPKRTQEKMSNIWEALDARVETKEGEK